MSLLSGALVHSFNYDLDHLNGKNEQRHNYGVDSQGSPNDNTRQDEKDREN